MAPDKVFEIVQYLEKETSVQTAFLRTSWLIDKEFPIMEGNKEGYRLLAMELLKLSETTSGQLQELPDQKKFEQWFLDHGHNFYKMFRVVEADKQALESPETTVPRKALSEYIITIVFYAFILFSFIDLIVGFVAIWKWIA